VCGPVDVRRGSADDQIPPLHPEWQDRTDMPKNKTHRGTAKRVKLSATGKLLRQRAGKRHLLEKKSSRITRRLDGVVEVAPQDTKRIRRLLGL
jgi:large subunit ribosomal protein L35